LQLLPIMVGCIREKCQVNHLCEFFTTSRLHYCCAMLERKKFVQDFV
jgi:hypothetical protein